MTRIAAITPAHREHLRQLKADFDRAYDVIEDVYDRSSPRFRDAETLYRVWIKAIVSMAMALLDDLDALDIGGGGVNRRRKLTPYWRPILTPLLQSAAVAAARRSGSGLRSRAAAVA